MKKNKKETKKVKTEKTKKTKKKHILGTKEFIFNFISLVAMIGVGIYFGYRSLYYYSKQNVKKKEEAMTLNGLIKDNNAIVVDNNDGLHQDNDGYYFKGKVENNYVIFQNKLFRVIRINNDNTVRLVSEDYNASFMWGEDPTFENSNIYKWLNKTDTEHTGVYYNTIEDIEKVLVKTEYVEEILKDGKIMTKEELAKETEKEKQEEVKETSEDKEKKEETSKDKKKSSKNSKKETKQEEKVQKTKSYVTLLSIRDYTLANGMSSYLNNGKMVYILGKNENNDNLYIEEDGSIQDTDPLSGYGIRPVITLKKNTVVSQGNGTKDDPYVIKSDAKNYVDSYIKLGEDIWKVSSVDNDNLKLYLNGYLKINGEEIYHNYSLYNSIFDLGDRSSLANYLNTVYNNSLSYQGLLVDCNYYTGEISDDAGYSFENIYNNSVTTKVGLLNIFDYVSNNEFGDYFYLNLTSEVGSMEYNRYANGLLEEADVRDVKHIVPSICINKNSIKGGEGTSANPYTVE